MKVRFTYFSFVLILLAANSFAQRNLGKIHCVGDSLTWGFGNYPGTGGYRKALDDKLTLAGISHSFVGSVPTWTPSSWPTGWHDGHGGWTSSDLILGKNGEGNLSSWISSYQPDSFVVMIGRNDAPNWTQTFQDYTNIADTIFALRPQAEVFWCNVILPADQSAPQQVQCDVQDQALRDCIEAQRLLGRKITYIDCYRRLRGVQFIYYDFVHLNDKGYDLLANIIFRGILKSKPVLP